MSLVIHYLKLSSIRQREILKSLVSKKKELKNRKMKKSKASFILIKQEGIMHLPRNCKMSKLLRGIKNHNKIVLTISHKALIL